MAWKESIEEMKHADRIIERILFLEGIPNLSAYDKINVGSSVQQQLNNDLGLEEGALVVLRSGIKTSLDADDNAVVSFWGARLPLTKKSTSTGLKLKSIRLKKSAFKTIWRSESTTRVELELDGFALDRRRQRRRVVIYVVGRILLRPSYCPICGPSPSLTNDERIFRQEAETCGLLF